MSYMGDIVMVSGRYVKEIARLEKIKLELDKKIVAYKDELKALKEVQK